MFTNAGTSKQLFQINFSSKNIKTKIIQID